MFHILGEKNVKLAAGGIIYHGLKARKKKWFWFT